MKSSSKKKLPKSQRLSKNDPALETLFRHLDNIEIRLDDEELEVTATGPDQSTPFASGNMSYSQSFDLEDHPDLRKAVSKLIDALHIALAEPDEDYDPNRCDRCVKADCCCFPRIHLTETERIRILDHLGLEDSEANCKKYFRPDEDLGGFYKSIFRQVDGHCVFLKKTGKLMRCSIYEVRPQVCRDFDAGYCEEASKLLDL
jgi:Fe-S-cluster containining protein